MESLTIKISDEIRSTSAISLDDGSEIFEKINLAFQNNVIVILDFSKINVLTSTFLNAAIGQLYGTYDSEYLNNSLKIESITKKDSELLLKVINRAKEYFKDKKGMDKTIDDSIKDA